MQDKLIEDRAALKKNFLKVKALADEILDERSVGNIEEFTKQSNAFNDEVDEFERKYGKFFNERGDSLYRKLCDQLCGGKTLEDVIYGSVFGLDISSIKIVYKITVENGSAVVVGGELFAEDKEGVSSVWISESQFKSGPSEEYLDQCRLSRIFDVVDAGFIERTMLAFFQREYVRQQSNP